LKTAICQVCQSNALPFDVVDFNKSCDLANATGAPLSGIPVYYFLCGTCGFLFAAEMQQWSPAEFSDKVYNAQYILIDPDYAELRPRQNAEFIETRLGSVKTQLKHLDFGGGNGGLCRILRRHGWNSTSYDPYAEPGTVLPEGKYDLVTAFEVIEHAPDVNQVMAVLSGLLAPGGAILLTTSLSDGQLQAGQRLTWWYASPRNGHISVFSTSSLTRLLSNLGL